jgi:hypothetical protein
LYLNTAEYVILCPIPTDFRPWRGYISWYIFRTYVSYMQFIWSCTFYPCSCFVLRFNNPLIFVHSIPSTQPFRLRLGWAAYHDSTAYLILTIHFRVQVFELGIRKD